MAQRKYKPRAEAAPASDTPAAVPESNAPPADDVGPLQQQIDALKQAQEAQETEAKRLAALAHASASIPIEQQIDALPNLNNAERDWLRRNPHALHPANAHTLHLAFNQAMAAGHSRESAEYFAVLERALAPRFGETPAPSPQPVADMPAAAAVADAMATAAAIEQRTPPAPAQRKGPPVAAPVSRESLSLASGQRQSDIGKVTLTSDERDMARRLKISDEAYARGKVELERRRRAGLLQEG